MSGTLSLDVFAGNLKSLETRLRPALRAELATTAARAEEFAGDRYDERLHRRSGRLGNTIAGGVDDTVTGFGFYLRGGGDEIRYGRIQEQGGTVTPKKGKFLAIPVGPALHTSGIPKFNSPRDVGDLRFVSIHGGAAGLLVKDFAGRGKQGTGARSEVWYRLVRKVEIKPKHFLRDGFNESLVGLDARLGAAVTAALEGARG